MNLSGLSLLSIFKRRTVFKVSPRRAILSLMGTTIVTTLVYPQAQAKFGVYYQNTEDNDRIVSKCPTIKRGLFFPTPYLANGMLQAIWGANSTEFDPNIQFKDEILELPCGGKIGMYWASHIHKVPIDDKKKDVVVIILPGLTASAREPYVKNIAKEALDNGYEVVVYHNRGNEVELTLPQEGYLNIIDDFKFAVDFVKAKYPSHKIFAVGHSFGANTLVNYLGKYKEESPIKVAASIANPFDFLKAAQGLIDTVFDKYLAESLQMWARNNAHVLSKAPKHFNLEFERAMTAKSIKDFDEFITRRMTGFTDCLEYYEGISSVRMLQNINIPLLCMHSKDDPLIHHSSIPIEESLKNKNIIMLVTNNGGHVGWFHGFLKPKRWFPKPTVEFLNACYEEMDQKN